LVCIYLMRYNCTIKSKQNKNKMTQVQKNTLAKLQDGSTVVVNYKTPSGIKLSTLESLKKLGCIYFERISAPHLSGATKAYLITINK